MYTYEPLALHRLREEQLVRDVERRRKQLENLELSAKDDPGAPASVRHRLRPGGARRSLVTLLLRARRS